MDDLHPHRRQQRYVCDAQSKLQRQQRENQQGGLCSDGRAKLRSSSQQMKRPAITAVMG